MSRNLIGVLLGVPAAALIGWQVGGTFGAGIFGGYLLGAAVGGLSLAWQAHVVRYRPEQVMKAFVSLFFVKMAVLFACWVVLAFIPQVAERFDGRGFLLAYAVAVLLATLFGVFEMKQQLLTSTSSKAPEVGPGGIQR